MLANMGKEDLLDQIWDLYNSVDDKAAKKIRDLMLETQAVSSLQTESEEESPVSDDHGDV